MLSTFFVEYFEIHCTHLRANILQNTWDFFVKIPSNISAFQNAEVLQLNPWPILFNRQKSVLALQNK